MGKERPIIFSVESVKAILGGRKTMTRRVIKPQPVRNMGFLEWKGYLAMAKYPKNVSEEFGKRCTYGQVGDRLWVRETHYRFGMWVKNGFTKTGKQAWRFKPSTNEIDTIRYFNNPPEGIVPSSIREKWGWFKRPSLFMPHWASRLILVITEVRVERLQEISVTDIGAEGHQPFVYPDGMQEMGSAEYLRWFMDLWDSLNLKRGYGWETNPWVWVIKFDNIGVRAK